MLSLDKLALKLKQFWKGKEREGRNREYETEDSEISLVENNEKINLGRGKNFQGFWASSSFILPTLYLIMTIVSIGLLLILKCKNKIRYDSDVAIDNMHIPNYYNLKEINPILFQVYTYSTSLFEILIVLVLFCELKQRFKVPEFREDTYKLYIMLIFGLISGVLNIAKGVVPFMENYTSINQNISKNYSISFDLYPFVELSLVLFTIFFAIYSLSIFNLLLRKEKYSRALSNDENNWYCYKIVLLAVLSFIVIIYIVFMYEKDLSFFPENVKNYIKENYKFVKAIFPYYIHVLHSLLLFSFYFELKYINKSLSQNVEVDYLFECNYQDSLEKGETNDE